MIFEIFFRPALQIITQDAHNLSNTVSFTAALADNISGKVRELDVTKVCRSSLFNFIHHHHNYYYCNRSSHF